ncbi:MAG: hypothetical protein R3288_06460, partial [Woeseiaceae bacterium]|nr:hypothetical protein [Woeseiaceae bacterium]
MNKNLTYLLNTLALAIVPATASGATDCVPANTVEWESTKGGNGHFYEVIVADGIDWDTANALANDRFCNGVQGHLATLTSADEDTFVDERRDATPGINKTGGFFDSELWVGGFQPDGSAEPAGGWTWVNDEGLFDFTNWLAGEPNNAGAGESHLAIGLNNLDGWNDEGNLDGIFGYVVEYDGTATAEECLEECNPSGVQKVQLPASFVPQPGDELTQFIRLQGPDPRVDALGQCFDRRFLDVFEHFEPANVAMHGKLILPPHLCGSRDIIVVESNANFLVLSDVVRSEQIPEEVVTEFFPCLGALGDTELQRRGVFAWQTDNRFDLIERHTIELTNGCDSSRGSTRQLSFFV